MEHSDLINKAVAAREFAYAPYSSFKVGAALLTKDGKVYFGCNIENAAFGASLCAERVAFFKAISEGERKFEAIAIVGGKDGDEVKFCAPCGTCRQVMSEFCSPDFKVVLGTPDNIKVYTLGEILPLGFSKIDLE